MRTTEDRRVDALGQKQAEARLPAWSTALTRFMDDFLRIPGTNIRFGVDSVLGLLAPGAGDALAMASGIALLLLAFTARVPAVVIARMALNTIIDALLGAVPLVGDVFDVAWKSNRMNLKLIERFQRPGGAAKASDYVVVGLILLATIAALCVPFFALAFIIAAMRH